MDLARIPSPFRMQPGLTRLEGAAPPTPARTTGRHLREKTAVLGCWPAEALCAVPGYDPTPALAAIAREAGAAPADDRPPPYRVDGPLDADAPRLRWRIVRGRVEGRGDAAIGRLLEALAPERRTTALAALAFEEDFAVVDGASGTVPWLAVALPSRWAPETKVGLGFAAIHAPVADGARIVDAGEALLRIVTGGARHERAVWTVSADRRLHQHPHRGVVGWPPPSDADADALAAMASFRHERQRFFPLAADPATDDRQAVFSIRVESVPLAGAVRTPADARALHAAIASMSDAVLAYKGLTDARDRLLDWLRRRSD